MSISHNYCIRVYIFSIFVLVRHGNGVVLSVVNGVVLCVVNGVVLCVVNGVVLCVVNGVILVHSPHQSL